MEYLGAAEGFQDGQVILITLGSGYTPELYADGAARRFHLLDWAFYAFQIGFSQANQQQVSTTRRLYGQRLDFRYYNPLFTRESLSRNLGVTVAGRPDPAVIGLDSTKPAALDLLEDAGRALRPPHRLEPRGRHALANARRPTRTRGHDRAHRLGKFSLFSLIPAGCSLAAMPVTKRNRAGRPANHPTALPIPPSVRARFAACPA